MSDSYITIKDANSVNKNLNADLENGNYTPYHSIKGTVSVKTLGGDKVSVTGSVLSEVTNFPAVQTITASLEDRLGITGSVNVTNFPSTQQITGTVFVNNLPSTQQITGTVSINNFPATVSVSNLTLTQSIKSEVATSIQETISSSFVWNTETSGTFRIADVDNDRKEIMIFNTGPQNLYIKLSSVTKTDNDKHGFTLINTASVPSVYNFIIYPSGTYISSEPSRVLYHAGYFVSSSITGAVVATSIT